MFICCWRFRGAQRALIWRGFRDAHTAPRNGGGHRIRAGEWAAGGGIRITAPFCRRPFFFAPHLRRTIPRNAKALSGILDHRPKTKC